MVGYTVAELMVSVIAHDLKDGEVAIMGANSMLPLLGCRLAQLMHAPNSTYIAGGSGAINPFLAPLVPSSCDARLLSAECVLPLPDICDFEAKSRIDVFYAGGIQIDMFGNCNLISVGPWQQPKFRGPGTAGLPFLPRAKRFVIYTHSHTRRQFVEKVDFISGPGFLDGKTYKERLVGTGPSLVVTPFCVLDFEAITKRMRLKSVHPGVSVQTVIENTGFELVIPATVPSTPEPTETELELMSRLDPYGAARNVIKVCV